MYPISIQVTIAPTSTALVSPLNLRSTLGIEATDAETLFEIELAVDAATGAIQQYCNRVFARRSLAARYRTNEYFVMLEQLPVIGSLLVEERNGDVIDVSIENGYRVVRQDGEAFQGIVNIHYEGGYHLPSDPLLTSTLPKDVELACQDLAKWFFLRRARDPQIETEALTGLSAAGYVVPMAMPDDVATLLDPYRLLRL